MEENLRFPLHIQEGGEDFVIKREEDDDPLDPTSPSSPEVFPAGADVDANGVRLKRRRRCGQCGPCQVKENCNKCNYCMRRDVLKQTCVYRKCIYLRSKPKPYSRPSEGNQSQGQFPNPLSHLHVGPSPAIPSFGEGMMTNFESLENAMSGNHRMSSTCHMENVRSRMSPRVPEPFSLGMHPGFSGSGIAPFLPASIPSSLPSIMHQQGIQGISGITDHAAANHHPSQHQFATTSNTTATNIAAGDQPGSLLPQNNSQSKQHGLPPLMGNQSLRDFSSYQSLMGNMGQQESAASASSSSCLYPQGMMATNMQEKHGRFGLPERSPTGSLYFPSDTEMLRHLSALQMQPPFRYPGTRYGQNWSSPPFPSLSGFGMPAPPGPSFSLPPHDDPSSHGWPRIPQSFPSCDQVNQCPKNGFIPPASQTLGSDIPAVQERCTSINFKSPVSSLPESPFLTPRTYRRTSSLVSCEESSRGLLRPDSALSTDSGFMSMNSDIECDISIDDCQMNAFIRSDGQNVLHIEIDNSQKKGPSPPSPEKRNMLPTEETSKNEKISIKGTVSLKQDLGEEGIVQLDLPGNRVFLEPNCYLDDKLASYSCNLTELLEFIGSPKVNKSSGTCSRVEVKKEIIHDSVDSTA